MFDIGSPELLLIAIVAIVVIGPKDLPKAMRVAGYWVSRARGVMRQFRSGFDAMVREAELAEMEKRWASENERIMREHPTALPAPGEEDRRPVWDRAEPQADAPPADAPAADAPVEASAAPSTADTRAPDAPVMVEKPVVAPAEPSPAEPSPADADSRAQS